MKSFFLLVMLYIGIGGNIHAQKQGRPLVDSLIALLASAREDTNKVNILDKISAVIWSTDPEAGIAYGRQAIALAGQLNFSRGLARAYTATGVNYRYKSEFDKALENYRQAVTICQANDDKAGLASAYTNMCVVYVDESDYEQALDYGFKSLKINEDMGNNANIARNFTNIGNIYSEQGDLPNALEYYTKSLTISEQLNDKNSAAINLCNIGLTYQEEKKDDTALPYLLRAKKICEELQSNDVLSAALCYLGNVYADMHDYTTALKNFSAGIDIDKQLGDESGMAEKLADLGAMYLAMAGDTTRGTSREKATGAKQEHLKKAIDFLSQAAAIHAAKGNIKNLMLDYRGLSDAWGMAGDYQKALEAHKRYMANKDSVFSLQSKKTLANLEARRALEVKDKQIQIDKLDIARKRNEGIFFIAGIVLLSVVILIVYRNYIRQKKSNHLLFMAKRRSETLLKRSEDLLLNILPPEVSAELKEKGTYEARSFENVTVLFSDFVNFTGMSEILPPKELIDELHDCFKAFDSITGRYNIEKIKTIGDAYLVVSGLPVPDPQHATHMIQAAIEMNTFMQERRAKLGDRTFETRIGVHSGIVVAGIVGVKKFAYDIWGDTVNVAARMEQNCEAGRINISAATYELVKDKFSCEYRGEIEVKGKGGLPMYYVTAEVKAEPRLPD